MPSPYRPSPTGGDGGADLTCLRIKHTHHVKIANDETTPSSSLQLINSTNTAAATPPPIIHNATAAARGADPDTAV